MAVATEVVARRYINISAGTPISVDYPLYEAEDVVVFYGNAPLTAVLNVDYTVVLDPPNFNTFILTPTSGLLNKINQLGISDPDETNYITVRRDMDYLTDSTPSAVRYTPFTSKEFDRTVMRFQQMAERLNRSISLTPNFVGETPSLELANLRKNSLIGFDENGILRASETPLNEKTLREQSDAAIISLIGMAGQVNGLAYASKLAASYARVAIVSHALITLGDVSPGDGMGNIYADSPDGGHAWRHTFVSSGDTARTWWETGDILRDTTVRIPEDFSNLNAMYSYLNTRRVRAKLSVQVSAGVVNHATKCEIDHPDAHNISVKGVSVPLTVLAHVSTVLNSAMSQDVTLSTSNTDAVSVGDFLYVPAQSVPDVANSWIEGTWRILSKTVNTITVRTTLAPTALPTLSVANLAVSVLKSVLRWNSMEQSGIIVTGCVTGTFDTLVIDGTFDNTSAGSDSNAANGISICGWVHAAAGVGGDVQRGWAAATFRTCGIVRWRGNGSIVLGGHLDVTTSHFCSNGCRGTQAGNSNAAVFGKQCVVSGNRKAGATFENGGSLNHNNSTIAGNLEQGVYGIAGGAAIATGCKILHNVQGGVDARDHVMIEVSNSRVHSNGTYNIIATGWGALVRVDGITGSGAGTADLRVTMGGQIQARTAAPTLTSPNPFSIAIDNAGSISIIGTRGEMQTVRANSTTSPYGGWAAASTSNGDMVWSTRSEGGGALTAVYRTTANEFRPETDLGAALGRANNAFSAAYAGRIYIKQGEAAPTTPGFAILFFDEGNALRVRKPDGTTNIIG